MTDQINEAERKKKEPFDHSNCCSTQLRKLKRPFSLQRVLVLVMTNLAVIICSIFYSDFVIILFTSGGNLRLLQNGVQ